MESFNIAVEIEGRVRWLTGGEGDAAAASGEGKAEEDSIHASKRHKGSGVGLGVQTNVRRTDKHSAVRSY